MLGYNSCPVSGQREFRILVRAQPGSTLLHLERRGLHLCLGSYKEDDSLYLGLCREEKQTAMTMLQNIRGGNQNSILY